MGRGIRRDAVAIILVAIASGLVSAFPPFSLAHGWSIDALTALRWEFFGARRDPASTPVAVIAIDEETYETPPFKGSPTLTWTTEIGRVLSAVIDVSLPGEFVTQLPGRHPSSDRYANQVRNICCDINNDESNHFDRDGIDIVDHDGML